MTLTPKHLNLQLTRIMLSKSPGTELSSVNENWAFTAALWILGRQDWQEVCAISTEEKFK